MSTWTVLKDLVNKDCLTKKKDVKNMISVKYEITSDSGEKLEGHISDEDDLT